MYNMFTNGYNNIGTGCVYFNLLRRSYPRCYTCQDGNFYNFKLLTNNSIISTLPSALKFFVNLKFELFRYIYLVDEGDI